MNTTQELRRKKYSPRHYYTSEEIEFLKNNIKSRSYLEVQRLFNERFGLAVTFSQITNTLIRYGLRNGVCSRYGHGKISPNSKKGICPPQLIGRGFKPGHNSAPIGKEYLNKVTGYLMVKIDSPDIWKAKHILIWEAANGPVPEGYAVIFADGNKSNFDLDNLLLVSRAELGTMNRLNLIFPDRELTKIGKTIAGLTMTIKSRIKKEKEHGSKV
jgi:hypothetical protein